jgi:hypothetical protein
MNDIEKLWNERKLASAKAKANFDCLTNCKWKEGDEVICIIGKTYDYLTVGKTYKVLKLYKEYGIYHVEVRGDNNEIATNLFCSRFTTLKLERLKKLYKLKDYENTKKERRF